jgi:hypothetical protein
MNGPLVPLIALFFLLIQNFLTAVLVTEMARPHGKKKVMYAVAASVVVGALAGYAWTFVLSTSVAFTILASMLVAGGIAYRWAEMMARDIAEQLRMAATVAKFGRENFELLDKRGEGEFGTAHIHAALESGSFTEGGQWLLKHMQKCIADIGHVAGVQSAPVAVPHGAGYVYVVHRVNRRDLETYEHRINEKYRAWR